MVIEIFHWLWLAILLGAAVALRTTAGWREGVARHTSLLVDVTILAVVGELVWRIMAPSTVAPLASWAAALFFFSLALSALERHRRAKGAHLEDAGAEDRTRDEGPEAEDPFRSFSEARGRKVPRSAALASGDSWARLCLEQTVEAIAVLDLEGEIEWVNSAWAGLHGYQTYEIRGHHLSLFYRPDQVRDRVLPALEEARRSGAWAGEVEHRGKDGRRFTTVMGVSLLREDGGPLGYVAVARSGEAAPDVEPGKTREVARSEQEAETLRVLAGNVAHELNNLLTGILGNASLLDPQSPTGAEEEIRDIESAARRAAELARLLQTYTGKSHSTAQPMNLTELVRAAAEALEEAAGDRCDLCFELAMDLPIISADPEQMLLLTRNLVANAGDASGTEGSVITIRTGSASLDQDTLEGLGAGDPRAPGHHAFLEVADAGHGMEDEVYSRMFEPLYSTRPGRRGVGLTAVAGIVRSHRGAIETETAPGQGCRVRIYFPAGEGGRAEPPSPEIASSGTTASPAADLERELTQGDGTILVIDNEKIIRDLVTGILSKQGFSVLTAADGVPALTLYRRHRAAIRAVLLDLSMPMMGGEEFYRELRSIDPGARVILMTGHDAMDVRKSFEGRLAGVLQKPFKPEELLATLCAVLA